MPGISAVLIVKNEETKLERCLRSLAGVDQIVVHDTGSTDKTVELAKSLGADVSVGAPIVPFHFAQARNQALRYAKEDWILTIDADEALRPGSLEEIRKAFCLHPEANGFNLSFVMLGEDGKPQAAIMKLNVFERRAWSWRYRVHERLFPVMRAQVADVPGAVIYHLPLVNKEGRRNQNLELLRLSVLEDPENLRNFRQLGLELFSKGEFGEAIPHLERFLTKAEGLDYLEKSQAMIYIGRCHEGAGRLEEAVAWFDKAAKEAPWRREPLWYAGLALMKGLFLDDAKGYFERVLAIPVHQKPGSHLDLDIWHSTLPQEALAECDRMIAEAKAKWEAMRKEGKAP